LDQVIDNLGNKTSKLTTFNDNKDIIGETTINTTINPKIADDYYEKIVE